MRRVLISAAAAALAAGGANAGGIDRSGQPIGFIFEPGNVFEFSIGGVAPRVTGNDVAAFGGGPTGDVANDYLMPSLSIKSDINDSLSFGVIYEKPFGADVAYATSSVALGGTRAFANSESVTAVGRYKFGNGFSAHAGVRFQSANAQVNLRGLAYGPFNGYSVTMAPDSGIGWLAGVAYEIPDIAARVALTYNSAITHNFITTETIGGFPYPTSPGPTTTTVRSPQSVNLDFQSGVAENTLIFGSVRWADWSNFMLNPAGFSSPPPFGSGGGLISLQDSYTYTLGVGRRVNDMWSGAFSVTYEAAGNPLVSPLAPTNGRLGATLAVVYTRDNVKVTTGINWTKLGNAMPETGTPDTARANMTGNSSLGAGVKVAIGF